MNRLAPTLGIFAALLLLAGTVAFTANSEEKGAPPPSSYPSKSPAVDLYSLTESVAKRARDLDMADLRLQEERKLLEKVKEEVRQQIALLDRKLAELSKRAVERDKERRAARQYLARVFRAMEAEDAAKRLRILGERETALILRELKEKDAAKILARMEPGFAASVAQKMEKD